MARRDLVRCPVFGVSRLNGSLLGYVRKDLALVSHCVLGWGREAERGRRHISFAPRL
ncbi:hypothetical protein [Desulfosporosinus sp. BG]|uniref:hypothetical protein n=1 Tax=Desulfosporosinus sp. BG TaxID=1633135 RepID=UPI00159F349C|nr:hypothetical protein [Desulfosporosinus sp. BG]